MAALADSGPTPIAQDDTFFHCASGRLKLRVFDDGSGELIAYERSATAGPKPSHCLGIAPAQLLAQAYIDLITTQACRDVQKTPLGGGDEP